MLRLDWTPFFCRTKYQKTLALMLKKTQYKLHKDLDIGPMMKSLRECKFMVDTLASSKNVKPETLKKGFETHYSNVIDLDLDTDASIVLE